MSTVNKAFLLGRLTRDPQVKHLQGGKSVAEFAIAVDKFAGGEKKPVFVDIKAWEKLAEVASNYLHRGDPVHIEGRIDMDQWADKSTGQQRTKLFVVAERLTLLGKSDGATPQSRHEPQGSGEEPGDGEHGTEDDLPF